MHGHDAGVVELARDLGFLDEPLERLGAVHAAQSLERQMALQVAIPDAMDGAHPAARELALVLVALPGLLALVQTLRELGPLAQAALEVR